MIGQLIDQMIGQMIGQPEPGLVCQDRTSSML